MNTDNNTNAATTTKKVKIFFFPFIAAGHMLPLIGVARSFARHPDVQVTIIATPKNIQLFQSAIDHDRKQGRDISFLTIELPNKDETGVVENFLTPLPMKQKIKVFMAVNNLKDTLKDVLVTCTPDCLVSDHMHPWSLSIAEELGIPRIMFHCSSLFTLCCEHILSRFKPHENVNSDNEPFVLEGLPDEVQFTKKMIPHWHRQKNDFTGFFQEIERANENSYGVIINSFNGLESAYYNYSRNVMEKKVWLVGPVNSKNTNKVEDADEMIASWLNSKKPKSVLYVCFGSEAPISKDQFHEIAYGLKSSGHPFIWVARTEVPVGESDEEWFPKDFEKQMKDSNQGLILKGWAPQVMILGHPNVGGFMTHCGWNACIEGVANELPMITWPITTDQFFNESLLVDVVKVGVRVGNKEEASLDVIEAKASVGRDQVEAAIRCLLDGGEVVEEIRRRVKVYAEEAKKAVLEGGSSYLEIESLIQEFKTRKMK